MFRCIHMRVFACKNSVRACVNIRVTYMCDLYNFKTDTKIILMESISVDRTK